MKFSRLIWLFAFSFSACQSPDWEQWEVVYQSGNIAKMDSFIELNQTSGHIETFRFQRQEASWAYAKYINTTLQYKQYLTDYPSGPYSDSIHIYIRQIQADSLNFASLTDGSFVGSVHTPNNESSILSMRFIEIQTKDDQINFITDINFDQRRYQLAGQIDPTSNQIQFTENLSSIDPVPLCDGRIYIRDNKLLIQSVHVSQHWSVLKYN